MAHNEQPPAVGRDQGLKGIGGKNVVTDNPNRLSPQDYSDLVAAVRRSRSDSALADAMRAAIARGQR